MLSKQTDVEWKSISEIISQKTLLDVHKAIQRVSAPVFHDLFKFLNHAGRTLEETVAPSRPHCLDLSHESKPKQEELKTFKLQGCKLFNELPREMKTEKSIVRFKGGKLKSL